MPKMKSTTKPMASQFKSRVGFLMGGGDMARRIEQFPWSDNRLGPLQSWQPYLKHAISFILNSPLRTVLLVGDDGIMIYNDAYAAFAGERDTDLLGSQVADGLPEAADFHRQVLKAVLAGKTVTYVDQQLKSYRRATDQEMWMDLNYSPVLDDGGMPFAVVGVVLEATNRIVAESRRSTTETALQAERQRLHDLFMRAPGGIAIVTGPDLRFQLVNKPFQQLLGAGRNLAGQALLDAVSDLDPKLIEMIRRVSFQGERFEAHELPVTLDWDSDGSLKTKYLDFICEPYMENNQPNGLIAYIYDMTQQVKSRKEVEDQNRVLEMLAGGSSFETTLDFLIRTIEMQSSDGILGSILLMSDDGTSLQHGSGPSLPASYLRAIDGIAVGPKVGSCGTAAYRKQPVFVSDIASDPLWTDFRELAAAHSLKACWSTPIFGSDKQVLGTFALYYRDVHRPTAEDKHSIEFVTRTAALIIEHSKAEDLLRQSEERFRFMAETLPLKIFTADAGGKITYFNPQWSEFTGKSMKVLMRDGVRMFMHPEDAQSSMQTWMAALKTGTPLQNEQRLLRHDGQYRRHVSFARPMRDNNGRIISWFGSMTDIEDVLQTVVQKEKLEIMTAGLKEQRAQLVALNNAKDEFITLSSHQLRTPATAVKQYIHLVLGGHFGALTPAQLRSLTIAYESNERQLNIINDLLKTAQIDSNRYTLKKQNLSIVEVLRDAIAEMQSSLRLKGQVVSFDPPRGLPKLLADRSDLNLVFINLLENASKYSYPNSAIEVIVTKKPKALEIAIIDEGVGIEKQHGRRIFEKFTRIDNELSDTVSGTGLGLYWVKRILALHGGSIKVISEPKLGSRFIVSLPL